MERKAEYSETFVSFEEDRHPINTPVENDYSAVEEAQKHLAKVQHERRIKTAESVIESEDEKVFLMHDTGFNTAQQAAMYLKLKEQSPQLSNKEINKMFAERTALDIKGYYWEFLARQPVLINFLDLDEKGLVSSKTGQRLLEVINDDERSGAIKDAIEHLEEHIADAPSNSLFAIHSPHGWAKDGFDDLPDDQIYLYRLDKNKNLSAVTLRLSMDLEDHEDILKDLIGEENINQTLDIKSRLIQASNAIVYLDNHNFEDYVDIIQKQIKTAIAWRDKTLKGELIKTHSFKEVHKQLDNLKNLENIDDDVEKIIADLEKFINKNIDFSKPKNLRKLIIKMGKTALDIQYKLEQKNGRTNKKDYNKLSQRAQELGGCVATASNETRTKYIDGVKHFKVKRCGNCGVYINEYIPSGYRCKSCNGIYKGC